MTEKTMDQSKIKGSSPYAFTFCSAIQQNGPEMSDNSPPTLNIISPMETELCI